VNFGDERKMPGLLGLPLKRFKYGGSVTAVFSEGDRFGIRGIRKVFFIGLTEVRSKDGTAL